MSYFLIWLTEIWTHHFISVPFLGHLLADSIDNSINKDSLAALIQMPGGCVEQNLAGIILPLIAAHYMDRSLQWDSVGMQRRDEAIFYIKKGNMVLI